MKLELKHLAPYLPYGLKCQYEGIINGAELSAQDKAYKENGEPFDWSVTPVNGLKLGTIKSVHLTKDGRWRVYIGQKAGKAFYNGFDFKPLLRPLSSMNEAECDAYNEISGMCHSITNDFYDQCYRQACLTNLLASRHIDMFGLIVTGLAIDINTL